MPLFLFSPLTWLMVFAGGACLLGPRLPLGVRVLAGIVSMGLVLLCMPLGANALVAGLQDLGQRDHCPESATGPIVVLSGGFSRSPDSADHFSALNEESWKRLETGLRLAGEPGGERLLIAGGGPGAIKESDMLRQLALRLDDRGLVIEVETQSRTTWESAQALKGRFQQPIRLVTSPLHAPRAAIALRAAGIAFCVVPSASRYVAPNWAALFPQASAVGKSETALFELAGGLYYRVRGYLQ